MIALLTIHYHSPEALCIRSDGAREGGGGDEGRGQGRAMKRKRELGFGGCLFAGGPAVKQYELVRQNNRRLLNSLVKMSNFKYRQESKSLFSLKHTIMMD